MRRIVLPGLLVAAAILPALAAGHPPGVDNHNSCLADYWHQYPDQPPVLVTGTLSYLAPLGTSPLPCKVPPDFREFGSHSPACPGGPGPIPGAYCGTPAAVPPGGFATCTWWPLRNTVPTELVIGFDGDGDGRVNLVASGFERPVWGTYPPGSWLVPNPYPVPATVIGFPTNIALPPDPAYGVLAPNDQNYVICTP